MSDRALVVVLIVTFAAGTTAHVSIAIGLASRTPRWRAWLALVLAPLAPYLALRERMRFRAGIWILAAAGYAAARLLMSA